MSLPPPPPWPPEGAGQPGFDRDEAVARFTAWLDLVGEHATQQAAAELIADAEAITERGEP